MIRLDLRGTAYEEPSHVVIVYAQLRTREYPMGASDGLMRIYDSTFLFASAPNKPVKARFAVPVKTEDGAANTIDVKCTPTECTEPLINDFLDFLVQNGIKFEEILK